MSDSLFRGAFSNPLVARQFLAAWPPAEFLALAERREDVVYRIHAAGGEVHFYQLVEHQLAAPRRWSCPSSSIRARRNGAGSGACAS